MKIIDSKGKLFGKVNIIDLAVIIVAVVLVLSAMIKFDRAEKQMTSDKVIEYTLKIKQIRQPTIDALNEEFTEIKETDTEKVLGDITDIEITPAQELVKLNDGSYKIVELKEVYDALLTIRVQGTETEDNYYTHTGKKLIVGEKITINNEHVTSAGTIKSVKVVE